MTFSNQHETRKILILALALAITLSIAPASADENFPTLQEVLGPLPGPASVLIDESGRKVGEVYGAKHLHVVHLAGIPEPLKQALIDTEDPTFFGNPGFDPRGLARALLKNLMTGRTREGGSTLTQQLAKTLLGDRSRTIHRKVKEAWLAVQLEQQLTKEAILERYLNEVWWGHGAYGIGAAAEVYFNQPVRQLTVNQAALLVGMLRGPAAYDPFDDRTVVAAARRRRHVLFRMVSQGHLTQLEAERMGGRWDQTDLEVQLNRGTITRLPALKKLRRSLGVADRPDRKGEWFRRRVAAVVRARHGARLVNEGGLTIKVTMDSQIQDAAEKAALRSIGRDGRRFHFSQVAVVAVEPATGKIRALVGGLGHTQYDRTLAKLQPGSSFKPFVYLAAFGQGRRPDDPVEDRPIRFRAASGHWYVPQNDDHKYRGTTTLRAGLEHSINTVAVSVLADVGIAKVKEGARKCGIVSHLDDNLTLALGSSAVSPIEMADAYATFANDGVWTQPVIYTEVADPNGKILERPVSRQARAAEVEPVRHLVDALSGVLIRGTAAGNAIGRPAAGKTGTTDGFRDAWFVGFTPQLSTAVWVGNDDRSPMRQGSFGGRLAARVWKEVMIAAHRNKPIERFPPPPSPEPADEVTPEVMTSPLPSLIPRGPSTSDATQGPIPLGRSHCCDS